MGDIKNHLLQFNVIKSYPISWLGLLVSEYTEAWYSIIAIDFEALYLILFQKGSIKKRSRILNILMDRLEFQFYFLDPPLPLCLNNDESPFNFKTANAEDGSLCNTDIFT